jgi:hypothetical protein
MLLATLQPNAGGDDEGQKRDCYPQSEQQRDSRRAWQNNSQQTLLIYFNLRLNFMLPGDFGFGARLQQPGPVKVCNGVELSC